MEDFTELLTNRIYEAANVILQKIIKPDFSYETVTELSMDEVERIKSKFGIEGIIIDVDDTLRKDMKRIPYYNQEWLDEIRKHLKVIVVSNGMDKNIEQYLQSKGIDYIGFAFKPLKKGFKQACERMGVAPEKVLVIGDQLIDDIYGGKRNRMMTMKVVGAEPKDKKKIEDEGR